MSSNLWLVVFSVLFSVGSMVAGAADDRDGLESIKQTSSMPQSGDSKKRPSLKVFETLPPQKLNAYGPAGILSLQNMDKQCGFVNGALAYIEEPLQDNAVFTASPGSGSAETVEYFALSPVLTLPRRVCLCLCGCRRRPRCRHLCNVCGRLVGTGCCLGVSAEVVCHCCIERQPEPEPDPGARSV